MSKEVSIPASSFPALGLALSKTALLDLSKIDQGPKLDILLVCKDQSCLATSAGQ